MNKLSTIGAVLFFFVVQSAPATEIPAGSFWQYKGEQKNWDSTGGGDVSGIHMIVWTGSELEIFALDGEKKIAVSDSTVGEYRRMITPLLHRPEPDPRKYIDLEGLKRGKWITEYKVRLAGSARSIDRTAHHEVVKVTTEGYEIKGWYKTRTSDATLQYLYSEKCQCITRFSFEAGTGPARKIELVKFGRTQ